MSVHPAHRLRSLRESTIREMTRLALQHDAINLSQGFPDFPPPPEVKQAAVEAILQDINQYTITWGLPETRAAVADKMARRYGIQADPERHVTITCGVTEAIVAAMMATVNPGDEVVLIEPAHENFIPAVQFAGGTPVFVPLLPPDFALDPDRLRRAFGPKTRAIIVNTPHNPTGRVFTRQELTLIGELAEKWNAVIVTDEIYEHILYDGREHVPPATLPGLSRRVITIGGLSKTYAVTGWRLGYAVALDDALSTALRTVHDFTTICAPTPLQRAAVVALHLPDAYYEQMARDYAARREVMMAALAEAGFQAREPEGAYYVLADYTALGWDGTDDAFARWLTTEVRVAVVPGSSFYHTPGLGANTVRFAFPKRLETLRQAGERLQTIRDLL